MPKETRTIAFVLEDSFLIAGRGWVLAPPTSVESFAANSVLAVEVTEPNGAERSVAATFQLEHFRLVAGGSKWHGVVVVAEHENRILAGSRLVYSEGADTT